MVMVRKKLLGKIINPKWKLKFRQGVQMVDVSVKLLGGAHKSKAG